MGARRRCRPLQGSDTCGGRPGQAESLAPVLIQRLNGSRERLDPALRKWVSWRDRDATEYYWLACDMCAAGAVPAVLPELMRRLLAQGKMDLFVDLLTHRSRPSKVLTPPRPLGATGRLLARPGCDRRALLAEVGSLMAADARRTLLAFRPAYAPEGEGGGATVPEVDDRLALIPASDF